MTADNPLLTLTGLVKRYGRRDLALDQVDLCLDAGQIMALIGPSGAGKSTLIRCINQLVPPTAGNVVFDGGSVVGQRGAALRATRRRISMIFQDYALVDRLSVMENVLSGQLGQIGFWRAMTRRFPPATVTEAFRLIDRVGLTGLEDKRADALSGGQRQRVGIARALLQNPKLLLVDEPTASLDPKTSRQIMRLICELCHERDLAAIINIHDVRLAQLFCPRIVGLRDGKIVFDGAASDLTPSVLSLIYGEEDWTAAGPGTPRPVPAAPSPTEAPADDDDSATPVDPPRDKDIAAQSELS